MQCYRLRCSCFIVSEISGRKIVGKFCFQQKIMRVDNVNVECVSAPHCKSDQHVAVSCFSSTLCVLSACLCVMTQ